MDRKLGIFCAWGLLFVEGILLFLAFFGAIGGGSFMNATMDVPAMPAQSMGGTVVVPAQAALKGEIEFNFVGIYMEEKDSSGAKISGQSTDFADMPSSDRVDGCKTQGNFGIAACIIMILLNFLMGCFADNPRKHESTDPGPAVAIAMTLVYWIFGSALLISYAVNCRDPYIEPMVKLLGAKADGLGTDGVLLMVALFLHVLYLGVHLAIPKGSAPPAEAYKEDEKAEAVGAEEIELQETA